MSHLKAGERTSFVVRAKKLKLAFGVAMLLLAVVSPFLACGASNAPDNSNAKMRADGSLYGVNTLMDPIATVALKMQDYLAGNTGQPLSKNDPTIFWKGKYGAADIYDAKSGVWKTAYEYWLHVQCGSGTNLCQEAQSRNLQCVEFVTGVFATLNDPLPRQYIGNGNQFWEKFPDNADWKKIPVGPDARPQRGDMIGWEGAEFGHIAIVVDVAEPKDGKDGFITVAEANAPGNRYADPLHVGNTYRMIWHTNGKIDTWPGYTVQGFIRQLTRRPTMVSPTFGAPDLKNFHDLPPILDEDKRWLQLAIMAAGYYRLYPPYFWRQIYAESGFDPWQRDGAGKIVLDKDKNPVPKKSSAGAIGIAQFMPGTAAGIPRCAINLAGLDPDCSADPNSLPPGTGIDPAKPEEAIPGAAYHMWDLIRNYAKYCPGQVFGECKVDQWVAYARALGAYNAGDGPPQDAIRRCGDRWLQCLDDRQPSHETRLYIIKIMGCEKVQQDGVTCSDAEKSKYP